jgi:DNA-binding XRE family transcriptional regulator
MPVERGESNCFYTQKEMGKYPDVKKGTIIIKRRENDKIEGPNNSIRMKFG